MDPWRIERQSPRCKREIITVILWALMELSRVELESLGLEPTILPLYYSSKEIDKGTYTPLSRITLARIVIYALSIMFTCIMFTCIMYEGKRICTPVGTRPRKSKSRPFDCSGIPSYEPERNRTFIADI